MNKLCEIGGNPVYGFQMSNPTEKAIVFQAGMQIDGDGAPRCYGPPGVQALDYLANAGHPPKDGNPANWWGILTSDGKPTGMPVIQRPGDPEPGYYIAPTSLYDREKKTTDPLRYVDSTKVPYVALPAKFLHDLSVKMGDIVVVAKRLQDKSADDGLSSLTHVESAIFADVGPFDKLGEGSIRLADALGISSSPKHGGTSEKLIYVIFPGSGKGQGIIPDNLFILNTGTDLLNVAGGITKVIEELP